MLYFSATFAKQSLGSYQAAANGLFIEHQIKVTNLESIRRQTKGYTYDSRPQVV